MKNIKAFTFIELIVCVSIIMVTSVFAVSSFSDFLNGREGNIRVGQFSDYIKGLDNKVMNKDIFNYKIVLDTALKGYFLTYENFASTNYIELNGSNLALNVNLEEKTRKICKFKNDKSESCFTVNDKIQELDFTGGDNYKIKLYTLEFSSGNFSYKKVSSLDLQPFDEDFVFSGYSLAENGEKFGKLEIINVGGKKEFVGIPDNTKEIFLHFDFKEKDNFLKLRKY